MAILFIADSKGRSISVVIPIKQYQKLIERTEHIEDVKAYDKAMRKRHKFIPLEEALKKLGNLR